MIEREEKRQQAEAEYDQAMIDYNHKSKLAEELVSLRYRVLMAAGIMVPIVINALYAGVSQFMANPGVAITFSFILCLLITSKYKEHGGVYAARVLNRIGCSLPSPQFYLDKHGL